MKKQKKIEEALEEIVYPSWIYYFKELSIGISILISFIILSIMASVFIFDAVSIKIFILIILIAMMVSGFFFGKAIIHRISNKLTITEKRIIYETGFIARKIKEIKKDNIRTIEIDQTVLERLFDIGTIKLATAGTGKYEIEFHGAKHPKKLEKKLKASKKKIEEEKKKKEKEKEQEKKKKEEQKAIEKKRERKLKTNVRFKKRVIKKGDDDDDEKQIKIYLKVYKNKK